MHHTMATSLTYAQIQDMLLKYAERSKRRIRRERAETEVCELIAFEGIDNTGWVREYILGGPDGSAMDM